MTILKNSVCSVLSVAKSEKMKKAFTIIELVTAVGLLAMVITFAGLIFKVSIEGQRTASANAEIMGKLRAITDQLNVDFKGQIWNPQGKVRFDFDKSYVDNKINYTAADDTNDVRSDSIIFFANGDFQSTGQYPYNGTDRTVVGNVACIFYALADVTTYSLEEKPDPKKKILIRRQTIFVSDPDLNWQQSNLEDLGEYCTDKSLADLIADPNFDANNLMDKDLAPDDPNDLVMYMAKGVDDFTIQYVGLDDTGREFNDWRPDNNDIRDSSNEWKNKHFAPLAFKFTFTLYDSRGVLQGGRRFTHIVYLGD
jgi:type II secretory pathway pseudopilin PulG